MTEVYDHVSGTLSDLDKRVVAAVPPGGNWRNLPEDFPSKRIDQIRTSAKNGGGSRSTYYGRLRWNRPAYTISTYITRPGNGCFIHPSADRLITVREAARLQTFPDAVRFEGPMRARCTQIGNAVPPLLAYQLGRALPNGNFVDLFAGAGGLGMGLELAGHVPLISTDLDRHACKTLAAHAGPSHLVIPADLADPADFNQLVETTRDASPQLDLVVGGPPCQGFSTAGPCRIDDPRNRLLLAFIRFIEATRPARVMMENVPALRWRGGAFLQEVTERLVALGYKTSTAILHAEAYGVPQLRRRLIVQGTLDGRISWPGPAHPILDPSFRRDQPGTDGEAPARTVHDAISDLPVSVADDLDSSCFAYDPPMSDLQRWLRGCTSIDHVTESPLLVDF